MRYTLLVSRPRPRRHSRGQTRLISLLMAPDLDTSSAHVHSNPGSVADDHLVYDRRLLFPTQHFLVTVRVGHRQGQCNTIVTKTNAPVTEGSAISGVQSVRVFTVYKTLIRPTRPRLKTYNLY